MEKTLYNKKILFKKEVFLDNEEFIAVVLKDGDYYNVHVVSDRYKKNELNTLKLQESAEHIKQSRNYFTDAYLVEKIMEHFIWDRFYSEFGAGQISVSIKGEDE